MADDVRAALGPDDSRDVFVLADNLTAGNYGVYGIGRGDPQPRSS